MENRPTVCLYHKDCLDGTAAALVVKLKYPAIVLVAVDYHEAVPEEVVGQDVIAVDFCYQTDDKMERLLTWANSVRVIDHHAPTEENFEKFDSLAFSLQCPYDLVYAADKSGAMLTWATLFPEYPVPEFIRYVSDRDLWTNRLEKSREITMFLQSFGTNVDVWEKRLAPYYAFDAIIAGEPFDKDFYDEETFLFEAANTGEALMSYQNIEILRIIEQTQSTVDLDGHQVPCINGPRAFLSDALNLLMERTGATLAAGRYFKGDIAFYSLRSTDKAPEEHCARSIAIMYGGNGHRNAAGFKIRCEGLAPHQPPPVYPLEESDMSKEAAERSAAIDRSATLGIYSLITVFVLLALSAATYAVAAYHPPLLYTGILVAGAAFIYAIIDISSNIVCHPMEEYPLGDKNESVDGTQAGRPSPPGS